MTDPLIEVYGSIVEYKPTNIMPPKDVIFVYSPKLKIGEQTTAFF